MGVRIVQGPVWSKVEAAPEIIKQLHQVMSVKSPGARFSRAHSRGQWDGTIKFLRLPNAMFLTGFTDRIIDESLKLVSSPTDVVTVPVRLPKKPPHAPALHGWDFREYQAQGVEQFFVGSLLRANLQVPTGGGKTEIGLECFRRLGHNTIWITHLKDLMAQTIDRAHLRLPGLTVGQIGNGTMDPQFPLTVAMVQTLKEIDPKDVFWDAWRMVILDESHHSSATTWFDVAKLFKYAPARLGLSGTATTKDPVRDMRAEGATGRTIRVVSTDSLVEQGYLAKPTIHLLRPELASYRIGRDFRDLPPQGAERYQAVYQAGIIENSSRNDMIVATTQKHGVALDKILVLVTRIQHGEELKERIRAAGLWCEWLSGKEPLDRRQNVLKLFRQMEKGAVLVASTIFDEGMDIPEVDCLILAGGGESFTRTMQRVGRALRRRADKDSVPIYDFLDGHAPIKGTKLTSDDYLAAHSRQRVRDYASEGFEIVQEPAK